MTIRRRLAGLAAFLGILALVVGIPGLLVFAAQRLWTFSWSELWVRAQMPDDGTLVIALVQVVAWIAWAYLASGLLVEAAYRVRGMSAPSLRGLGLSQGAARHLVDAAVMLFVVVPVTTPIIAAPAHALSSVSTGPTPAVVSTALASPAIERAAVPMVEPVEATPPEQTTFEYTVKRNESLWKIAERFLGHGTAWTQIRDLNVAALGENPSYIEPGMVLRIPQVDAGAPDDGTYVVAPGDTLSGIAKDELGDARRYGEIFEASTGTAQPDGRRLTDPDVIRPGWILTIQGQVTALGATPGEPPTPVAPGPGQAGEPANTAPPRPVPTGDPAEPAPAASSPTPGLSSLSGATSGSTAAAGPRSVAQQPLGVGEAAAPTNGTAEGETTTGRAGPATPDDMKADDRPDDDASPAWLVPGLTGSGGILAGALLLTIRARRRAAARRRQTGMMLPPLPPQLRPTARTAATVGSAPSDAVASLTTMLAALAVPSADAEPSPKLAAAVIACNTVTLRLAEDASLPAPWSGSGSDWTAPLAPRSRADIEAPYPLLVPLGADTEGRIHLVNLEHLGTLSLGGDHERVIAFARFLATSVAINPWSARVCVYALGVAEELADIDHLRLRYFPPDDPSGIEDAVQAVDDALEVPDNYVLVLTTESGDREQHLAASISGHLTRPAVVLVSLGDDLPGSTRAAITTAGRLVVADLGIDVAAPGLTRDEAAACAEVVAATDAADSVPIPVDDSATQGWEVHANLAGALRPELVADRPVEVDVAADGVTLLPRAPAEYASAAPVTTDDVAVLAPLVREGARAVIEQDLDDLDRDLADFGLTPPRRPWIRLLGPVEAKGCGDRLTAPYRDSTRLDAFAYLALHPHGATAKELKNAGIVGNSVAQRTTELRTWLGKDPETGRPFLPNAHHVPSRGTAGPVYQLENCLCDVHLFRALRVRGQARGGDAGIADLVAALGLVEGVPFTQTLGHFAWVFEGERVDHIMTIAVIEVASVVIAHALANDDLPLARFAAEAAHKAAPDDDQTRLDLIAVAAREGHGDTAVLQLVDAIGATSDDYRSPIDPSERTKAIIARLQSSARGSSRAAG